ncbi:MAG: TolC family protein [Flaviaesturariibacter sp.]|nr:TolC family protein [Flaviaesturariibacter sp.]
MICLLLASVEARSQTYTLQQCIDTALAQNIPVKQAGLLAESAAVQLNQARYNLLPNLNADIFHGLSQGRSIDPNSNSYVNQSLNYASYQLNSGITLFNGGLLRNTIRQNGSAYEAAQMDVQAARDNLVLNVILAYLQVLNGEDLLRSATQRAELSRKEVERLTILDQQGAIKPSELSDLKGQYMNDQLAIGTARMIAEQARLSLLQWMNKPYDAAVTLERVNINALLAAYPATSGEVFEQALANFAPVKAAALRTRSYEFGVRTARSGFYPMVTLGGGLATNYSSTAQNATGKIPYNGQLKNNISTALGVGVTVPLFNRLQTRNKVKQADIHLRNSVLEQESIRVQLRQQIDQAYLSMRNAFERYQLLQEQVAAYTHSFQAAEARYNAGVGTSYDYLIAKDRMDQAAINLIGAQYDFVLRTQVLDYYKGKSGK